jgi:hypothetical protein
MRGFVTTIFAFSLVSRAIAQDPNDGDPPGKAARLSYINGNVSFQPGGVDDWVAATPNRPLTTGDRLWSDDGARVELNLGSTEFRLNSRTNFTFLNLDDKMAQIQLSLGTISVRVRRLADDESVEIDTPQVAFTLLRAGEYRVEVNEAGNATIVTVRGGDAEATANGQAFPIHAREQVGFSGGDGSNPVLDRHAAPPTDPFDNFCEDRDRREDMSASAKYVSRDLPGYADLDSSGAWRVDPQYGAVWVPGGVVVGWSPYHYGHWAWISPWGWTWVDDAPWGYAPFHYGRWAMIGPSWGWIPGPMAVTPVYAPAIVAFVGGAGFGAAISIGGGVAAVGWFPLGPRDVWVPSYQVSAGYMTRVNVSNTVVTEVSVSNVYTNVYVNHTTVVNVYVNQNIAGAVVAVRSDAMTNGSPIGASAVRVPPAAMVNVSVVHAAPVVPAQAAVLGGRPPLAAGSRVPPAVTMSRQVVAKAAPPPTPIPFARQQEALKANPGHPLNASSVKTLQASQPAPRANFRAAAPNAPAARVASPSAGNPANSKMNPPAVNSPAPAPKPEERPATVAPRPTPAPKPEERPATVAPRPTPVPKPEERPATVAPRPTPAPKPEERPATVAPRPTPAPKPEERPATVVPRPTPAPKPEAKPETTRPNPPAAKPAQKAEERKTSKPAKKTERTEKEK